MPRRETPGRGLVGGWAVGCRACVALVSALLALPGCQTARVQQPLTAELGGNDADAQLEFWHRLAEEPVTSNDDAFHGLLLFLDGEDPAADYAGRVAALRARGMLPGGFGEPPEQAVRRGTLAAALVRALDIRGGVLMALTGRHPRYAVREMEYMGLYPPSSENQTFNGAEFLGVIGKAEDYQRGSERAGASG
jgi:hypothetical protein